MPRCDMNPKLAPSSYRFTVHLLPAKKAVPTSGQVPCLRAKAHSWASTGCGEGLTFACEEEGDPEVPLLLPKKCSISYKLSHSIMEPISLAWSTKGASGGKTRPQLRVCSTWWMPVFHAICVVLNEPTEREQSVMFNTSIAWRRGMR